MPAQVGHRIIVDAHHVGSRRREGVIVEILPGREGAHFRVRWDGGGDSILFPDSDCMVVDGNGQPSHPVDPGTVDLRTETRVRTRSDMEMWFDEDHTHTEARVTIHLRDLELTGFGRAQRHPHDPSLPAVGEELSAARAMSDLAHQLLDLATYQLEKREGHPIQVEL